jgi:HK97 family phage portal protein
MAHLEIYRPARESWWQRAKRSLTLGPWNPKDREIARYFGGTPVASGVPVNEENVMSFSAVWAAVNLVSAHISSVPLVLYRVLPNGGKERFVGHPLYRLLHDRPNKWMGSALVRRTIQSQKMIWGEGFAEIERDGSGRPFALWPLLSYRMHPFFDGGQLYYRYSNSNGNDIIFDPSDILHIRAHSDNGINGIGMTRMGRESFGLAIAAERQAAAFYGNGMTMSGSITYPPGINLTPQAKEDNRKAIESRHMGSDRSYRLLTLYEGGKYEQLGVSPNEGQFLESRMFQVEEVARWTNIPPHKLKHLQRTSYNSIEHQSIEYVTDALDPDWVLWEQELNLKLVSSLEYNIQRIEHIREGMLRGDSSSRSDLQTKQFSVGGLTPNEVRAMENRNPVDGGDEPYVSLQNIPMSLARPYWEAQIKKAETPPPAPPKPQEKEPDPERDERERLLRAALQTAEDARDVAIDNARRADERAELIATAHAQDKDRYAAEVRQLGDALAEANTSLHDAASREQALTILATEQAQRVEALELDAGADRVFREQAEASLQVAYQGQQEAQKAAFDAATERDAAMALADEAVKERDAARSEVLKALEVAAGSGRDTAQAMQQAAASEAARVAAETERDAIRAEAETLRADLARTRADLATELDAKRQQQEDHAAALEAVKAEATTAKAQANADLAALKVSLEHATRDIGIARQEASGSALALEVEREQQRARKAGAIAAMRGAFVDASERLLQRESDRARKHQATAEKLRAWVDTFYPMHVETVRHTFRPLVGAWVAVAGGDATALLERLVAEHIDLSQQALMRVVDVDDEDERATLLERTLRKWETERAEAVADNLVREGLSNG